MLAIRKRIPITKLAASGMLAFTIGLTASAAYLSTTIMRMPYSFNTQQQTSGSEPADTAAQGVTKGNSNKDKQASASTIPVGVSEPAPLTSEWEPYVAPTGSSAPATTVPVQTSGATDAVSAPTHTATDPLQPAQSEPTVLEPVVQPVTNLVDGLVRVVGP